MAKTEVLNLDNLVSKKIHTPRVDNNPLYLRVDGGMDTGENIGVTRTDKWYKAAIKCYTSPDNIRRVFITHAGVYTHLYQPVFGYTSKDLKVEKSMQVDIQEVLQYMMGGQSAEKAYKLKGSGLAGIVRPWVCSNVEEVYFDWSVLIAEDVMNGGYGEEVINCIQNNVAISNKTVQELFYRFCMGNVKDLRTRFPRLKAVGYISNLEEVYKATVDKAGMKSIEDLKLGWYDNDSIKTMCSSQQVSICIVGKRGELNFNRSIKPNIYLFDKNILDNYFNNLEARIKKYYRDKRDNKTLETSSQATEQTQSSAISEFEKSLRVIENQAGIDIAKKSIMIALKGSTHTEREEIYNQFSEMSKTKYREVFNM